MTKNTTAEPHRLRLIRPEADASPELPPGDLPRPLYAIVTRLKGFDGIQTSVASLRWGEGAKFCGRCPRASCTLIADMCAVPVDGFLSLADAFNLLLDDAPGRRSGRRKPGG